MSKERILKDCILGCLSKLTYDYDIDIEAEDGCNDYSYFNVVVTFEDAPGCYQLDVRVDEKGLCEIEISDMERAELTEATLFRCMWIQSVTDV